jgi:LPXTG-motif cell wall-anchored protein
LAEEPTTTTTGPIATADNTASETPASPATVEAPTVDDTTATSSPEPADNTASETPASPATVEAPTVDDTTTTSSPEPATALVAASESLTAAEQAVTITITSPVDGATVEPGDPLEVEGTVTIGVLGTGVSIVYVVDTSGSTGSDVGDCNGDGVADAADDINGDGQDGEIIDCEIAGVQELEKQLAAINGSIETGLVSFTSGSSAETGFGSPGRVELDDAVTGLDSGGGTSFNSALSGMNTLFLDAAAGNRKIGYLFTDGFSSVTEGAGSPLQAAIDAGIVVNTFSVGAGAVGCGPTSPLTIIAAATGGQCIQVDDPADLTAVLEGLRPAGIEKVEVSVNGGPPVLADVDLIGNFKVTVTGIVVGPNKIMATVTTTDQQTASDEVTVNAAAPTTVEPTVEAAAPTTVEPTVEAAPPTAEAAPATPASLPRTGSDSLMIALIGAVLMLGGAALTIGASRRERNAS